VDVWGVGFGGRGEKGYWGTPKYGGGKKHHSSLRERGKSLKTDYSINKL